MSGLVWRSRSGRLSNSSKLRGLASAMHTVSKGVTVGRDQGCTGIEPNKRRIKNQRIVSKSLVPGCVCDHKTVAIENRVGTKG